MFHFLNKKPKVVIRPVVIVVMDGFGIAPPNPGNAIHLAKKPVFDRLCQTYPFGQIIASGEAVGLPANEVGNSEVGHLTLGVGRVIYQSLERINHSIKDSSIFANEALLTAFTHTRKHASRLHIMGLVGSGNVHSSKSHLFALLEMARQQRVAVALHAFTDGRDSPPKEAASVLPEVEAHMKSMGVGEIVSVSGRYYAMDRDTRWERIKATYAVMVQGLGKSFQNVTEAVQASYQNGKNDEFIEPCSILNGGSEPVTIQDNDAVIFFNFRVDRARELTMSLCMPDFEHLNSNAFGLATTASGNAPFERERILKNIWMVTFTEYQKGIPVHAIAFPPEERVANSLPEVLAQQGWSQLHMAESEKERMVTYYFDGARDDRFSMEEVEIVPSPKVATYDLKPEMALPALINRCVAALAQNKYRMLVINFANPDMVAHTGKIPSTIAAIEKVDWALGVLEKEVLARDGLLAITADHGNAEELITYPPGTFFYTSDGGAINTDHSNFPIPLLICARKLAGKGIRIPQGNQADFAPTLLSLLQIAVPPEMTGRNLIPGITVF